MASACRGCGKPDAVRTQSTYDLKGNVSAETCESCREIPGDKVASSTDRKLWLGHEVDPDRYEKVIDNGVEVYAAKDELRADLESNWTKDEPALPKREGRRQPLTAAEIESIVNRIGPIIQAERAMDELEGMGWQLPN